MDAQCAPGTYITGAYAPPAPTLVGTRQTPAAPSLMVPPRAPVVDPFAVPEPVAIAFDEINGLILVADRGLPLIHRVRISDGTLDTPIATGVPVRALAVTPRVPDSYALVPDPSAGNCP